MKIGFAATVTGYTVLGQFPWVLAVANHKKPEAGVCFRNELHRALTAPAAQFILSRYTTPDVQISFTQRPSTSPSELPSVRAIFQNKLDIFKQSTFIDIHPSLSLSDPGHGIRTAAQILNRAITTQGHKLLPTLGIPPKF